MQSTILFLQQELKTSKDTIGHLEEQLRNVRKSDGPSDETLAAANDCDAKPLQHPLTNGSCAQQQQQPTVHATATATPTTDSDNACDNNKQSTPPPPPSDERTTTIGSLQPIALRALRPPASTDTEHSARLIVLRPNGDASAEQRDDNAAAAADDENSSNAALPSVVNGTVAQPNGKRSFDEACDEAIAADATHAVQSDPSAKKLRRSSVLSLDLNEEDSRIDCDDERTLLLLPNNADKAAQVPLASKCNGLVASAESPAATAAGQTIVTATAAADAVASSQPGDSAVQ